MIRAADGIRRFRAFPSSFAVSHAYAAADAFGGFDARRNEDRTRLGRVLDPAARLVTTTQTHSARVARVGIHGFEAELDLDASDGGIDGLVSTDHGVVLHAVSADCPLLYLATDRGVAIAHCGWRGVAAGIVERTVARLLDATATTPASWVAAVSPGAERCCYEVGPEVVAAITARGVGETSFVVPFVRADGRESRRIALSAAIRDLLIAQGIRGEAIELAAQCTICGGEAFHSYRRRGSAAGRMSGVVARAAR